MPDSCIRTTVCASSLRYGISFVKYNWSSLMASGRPTICAIIHRYHLGLVIPARPLSFLVLCTIYAFRIFSNIYFSLFLEIITTSSNQFSNRERADSSLRPVDSEETQVRVHKRHARHLRSTGGLLVHILCRVVVVPREPGRRRPRRPESVGQRVLGAGIAASFRPASEGAGESAVGSRLVHQTEAKRDPRPSVRRLWHHQADEKHSGRSVRSWYVTVLLFL